MTNNILTKSVFFTKCCSRIPCY